jgi:hypothetical protein
MHNFKKLFLFLLGSIFLTGCVMSPAQVIVTPTLPPAIATSTPRPPTSTATVAPTAVPSATETVLPTLSPTQIAETVLDLYTNNGGCELPCWWGIVPGKTSIQEVYDRFSLLGSVNDETKETDKLKHYNVSVIPPSSVNSYDEDEWLFSLTVKNGIVDEIFADTNNNRLLAGPGLSTGLSTFGEPQEIWITFYPNDESEPPDYELGLFYPDKGVDITGSGLAYKIARLNNLKKVSLCPQEIPKTTKLRMMYSPMVDLWSPNEQRSFFEVDTDYEYGVYFHLSDISNMTTNQFYTTYLDPSATRCFNVIFDNK